MKHYLVAGGSGFLGSHICDLLIARGDAVIAVDNFSTSTPANVEHLDGCDRFLCIEHDVTKEFSANARLITAMDEHRLDGIFNMASPASPPAYQRLALETMLVGSVGTLHLLQAAKERGARLLMASTSEVYGDPHVHPQVETYWGHVNPIGPRSMYDESKRFSEALCRTFQRDLGTEVRIARIFNTYGPRLSPDDGRVVTNFLRQALCGEPLTIYGDGQQTRSFCYVSDLVSGLVRLMDSDVEGPVNIGNPGEFTMLELADVIAELTGSSSPRVHLPLPGDDPIQRRPDITRANSLLGWSPTVDLRTGLGLTIDWMKTLPSLDSASQDVR